MEEMYKTKRSDNNKCVQGEPVISGHFDAEAELAKIANEMCAIETEKFMEELMIGVIRHYESKYCGIPIKR